MSLNFRRERVEAEILVPAGPGYERRQTGYEMRWDPLTGQACKLLPESNLLPRSQFDLEAFGEPSRSWCPFCAERVEKVTPRFAATISADGPFRRGEALCFPNLAGYARHASVSIYGPERHFLPVEQMTQRLIADNLHTQVEFCRAATRADGKAPWVSISANHMLPSGSSLFHPHAQGAVDPFPTTQQAISAGVPAEMVRAYLAAERSAGERHITGSGEVDWLAAFAPVGFHDVRAFLPRFQSPEQLPAEVVEELAQGLAAALRLYAELGSGSFNWALLGAPHPAHVLNFRLVARAGLQETYRSDVTYFERLHGTALVDLAPEVLAERAKLVFHA